MSYFDDFAPDQVELLISLPFRAGLLVSECDEGGGEEAIAAEMQVLESLITGFAEDFLKSEFVEALMKKTLSQRSRWGEWRNGLEAVPRECRQALDVLAERLDQKDVLSFRQNIMEIAISVAMAYREEDGPEEGGTGESLFGRLLSPVLSALNKKPPPSRASSLNISKAERRILKELSAALLVDFDGNPTESAEAA